MVEAIDRKPWTVISALENPNLLSPAKRVISEIGLLLLLMLGKR
jgi:hypothetical protein